ncbi:MAG: DUF5615 family PIN-like protein [Anaerolineae bacterium]|nr:DUF5615 family PIN-like protein [Anaerolineae bacterium]MDQ7034727.1 DUF5615 family PIN-like protein [Anaerolineae bacterium]
MSKLKFFTDTHIPKQVTTQLRNRQVNVIRCQDVGLEDADDDVLLAYAIDNGCAMLSLDDDFTKLHLHYSQSGNSHKGIFYGAMKQFQGQIGAIVTFCAMYTELIESGVGTLEDDIHNKLIYLRK